MKKASTIQMSNSTETRISLGWDSQDRNNEGWHCEVQTRDEDGRWAYSDDSLKIWFPVDLDNYEVHQRAEVEAALLKAFPGAQIS